MPELAFVFSIGCLGALVASIFFYISELRFYKRLDFLTLQQNLKCIDLRWNQLSGQIESYTENSFRDEMSKARRTYLIFGFASVVLSWVGLLFLVTIWLSLKLMIKNRLFNALIFSTLAETALTKAEVQIKWSEIKSLGFD